MEKKELYKVAVMPFQHKGNHQSSFAVFFMGFETDASDIWTDSLNSQLLKSTIFSVVERGEIEKLISEGELSQAGFIDEKSRKHIGKLLGIDYIIIGNVHAAGGFWIFPVFIGASDSGTFRCVEVETGKIVWSVDAKYSGGTLFPLLWILPTGEHGRGLVKKAVKKLEKQLNQKEIKDPNM